METERNPHAKRRRFAFEVLGLASGFVEAGAKIEARARVYEKAGLYPIDALHLASAVEAGAAIFCTTDDQLLRRGREVETEGMVVLTPIELIESIEQ